MKRILFLLFVLAFALCGCQSSPERYPEIADMLDSGNFQGAIDTIRDMGGIKEASSKETSSKETASKETSSKEASSTEETSSVAESSAETSSSSAIKHGKVTITLENWDEYFEFVTEEYWEENAFGEATQLNFLYYFKLKDEYSLRNTSNSVAIEYTYKRIPSINHIPVTVDLEARTYTVGEFPAEILSGRQTAKFTGLPESIAGMGRVLLGSMLYEYYWDFDVTRVEGAIYLK